MQLKWLKLEHFRNYDDLELDFTKSSITALIGPNAQGKTNLLESIAFLALGKSFRTRSSMETLGWDRPHGRIKGAVEYKGKETELEVFFQRSPELRKVKTQNKVTTPKEFLGNLRVVIFTPDHLQLIQGSPSVRRQYMDRVLVQLDKEYIDSLTQYQRILKQRNALLKTIQIKCAKAQELELWDGKLIEEAMKLWDKRKSFISFLKCQIEAHYQSISGSKDELKMHYDSHQDNFDERLIAHRDSDIRSGSTSVGPHRDNFKLTLNSHDIGEFGSRGECRSAVLALKIAEIHFMEEKSGQKPILLLDDVFSELDNNRQIFLGKLLKDYQVVITTTSKEHIKGLKNATIYEVKAGYIYET